MTISAIGMVLLGGLAWIVLGIIVWGLIITGSGAKFRWYGDDEN